MNHDTLFLNIHSHRSRQPEERNVLSLDARNLKQKHPAYSYLSCGIHPWFITTRWKEQLMAMESVWLQPSTLLIGECGLDPNSSVPMPLQEEVFISQATWAVSHQMPMIIHCVKTFDRLIALYRHFRPNAPWIIHGFRGKPQQLKSLLGIGFLVSFGERFNPDTVAACPYDRFFLETDNSDTPITQIYQQIASVKQTDTERLKTEQAENLKQILKIRNRPSNH